MHVYTIRKQFPFEAAHRLMYLPEGHQCGRLHGHSYIVEVELQSLTVDPGHGFVKDYGELKPFAEHIAKFWDHRTILHPDDPMLPVLQAANEAPFVMLGNPSAENMAAHFHEVATSLFGLAVRAVSVKETIKTISEYRP